MSKIELDKYYTPPELAKYCVDKTKQIIGEENITEWLEPSAGAGAFLLYLDKYLAFDIEPEADNIEQKDYLNLCLPYLQGRCVIGNPPFGKRNSLSVKFYKKSLELGDYISFILPVSQYNNDQQMYEFDLIYSEVLSPQKFSDTILTCCFNIYKRPENGINNKPTDYRLKDVTIFEYRRNGTYRKPTNYDFGMCTWGNGSIGKEVKFIGQFAQESYIIVNNPAYKDDIIKIMKETDWKNLYPYISSAKIQTWKIYKYLKERIPELV